MREKRRRTIALIMLAAIAAFINFTQNNALQAPALYKQTILAAPAGSVKASSAIGDLSVKERDYSQDYNRTEFLSAWGKTENCDMRNIILRRDLTETFINPADNCLVEKGKLTDPYTNKVINFQRGPGTSGAVQIDHVVALADAWQTGAQNLSATLRNKLANDPLELLAVDGPANQAKSASDAADWLPPNNGYRCRYVARQIAIKLKYHLWVTLAEKNAMATQLQTCPAQVLPVEGAL